MSESEPVKFQPDGSYNPIYVQWWSQKYNRNPKDEGLQRAVDLRADLDLFISLRGNVKDAMGNALSPVRVMLRINPDKVNADYLAECRETFIRRLEGVLENCPKDDGADRATIEQLLEESRTAAWSVEYVGQLVQNLNAALNPQDTESP
jgi:hypothetical protein